MNSEMQTKDYQKKSLLQIFLSYFKPHLRLFALDMGCALLARRSQQLFESSF